MYAELNEVRLEHILPESGSLQHEGKPVGSTNDALKVREFLIIFYGASRDRKSREVAQALNTYAEYFNPDDQGLSTMKGEVICGPRAL